MTIKSDKRNELACYYKNHLLNDIAGFWEKCTGDTEYGGYFVPIDKKGEVVGTDKNMWCQARQAWMFSALYNQIDRDEKWLNLARLGRDFIVQFGYAGKGRWHYLLDRQGNAIDSSGSLFTDVNVLMALCEYKIASGSDEDMDLIEQTFGTIEKNLSDPGFTEFHHFNLDPQYRWHAPSMVVVGMARAARAALGERRVQPLVDYHLDLILNNFAKDEYKALFEVTQKNGKVLQTPAGLRLNPGHALESAWFCIEEGLAKGNMAIARRAAEVVRWSYSLGRDKEYGGLLAFVDPQGRQPQGAQQIAPWGERWDSKIWWVHAEALYALALASAVTGDETLEKDFFELHNYCRSHFADLEYGEWYEYLHRNAEVHSPDKGTWIKCAFHIPRAMMKLALLFESEPKQF